MGQVMITAVDSSAPLPTRGPSDGPKITSIDLFAGAGGLTAGLHHGSELIRTVRAVEQDIAAAATFEANHGKDLVYTGRIEQWLDDENVPEVDLVVGGPPCQGFSQLNRKRVGPERNALWEKYAETLIRARPRWFVLENVSTFFKSTEYKSLLEWTEPGGPLADYEVDARILLAADYGSPQKRRRTVLIGRHRDVASPGFPQATHSANDYITVTEAFKGIRPATYEIDLPHGSVVFHGIEMPGLFRTDQLHLTRRYQELSTERFRHIPANGNRFDLPEHLKTPGWKNHHTGASDVMGRMHADRPSVTIRTEFFKPEKGRYLHPSEHRAITHHEAARLQGFPDDYLWAGSKTDIARQIGNAVPLPLGAALGKLISLAARA